MEMVSSKKVLFYVVSQEKMHDLAEAKVHSLRPKA
jgi:hypothetical protein